MRYVCCCWCELGTCGFRRKRKFTSSCQLWRCWSWIHCHHAFTLRGESNLPMMTLLGRWFCEVWDTGGVLVDDNLRGPCAGFVSWQIKLNLLFSTTPEANTFRP